MHLSNAVALATVSRRLRLGFFPSSSILSELYSSLFSSPSSRYSFSPTIHAPSRHPPFLFLPSYSLSLSLCLSLCLSQSLNLSLCASLGLFPTLCFSLRLTVYFCFIRWLSGCLSLCLSLSGFLCLPISISLFCKNLVSNI